MKIVKITQSESSGYTEELNFDLPEVQQGQFNLSTVYANMLSYDIANAVPSGDLTWHYGIGNSTTGGVSKTYYCTVAAGTGAYKIAVFTGFFVDNLPMSVIFTGTRAEGKFVFPATSSGVINIEVAIAGHTADTTMACQISGDRTQLEYTSIDMFMDALRWKNDLNNSLFNVGLNGGSFADLVSFMNNKSEVSRIKKVTVSDSQGVIVYTISISQLQALIASVIYEV